MTIDTNTDPDRVRGEALGKTWWQGKRWAVTKYGLETLDGYYAIKASRLNECRPGSSHLPDWPMHMASKNWIDMDDFNTAFLVARAVHGTKPIFTPKNLNKTFAWTRKTKKHAAAFSRALDTMLPPPSKDRLRSYSMTDLNKASEIVGPIPADPKP